MLDLGKVRAISFDLDDTLWPIWPTIERAEKALLDWLTLNAPVAATLFADAVVVRDLRESIGVNRPDLERAGEDSSRAAVAFEVFFAERQRVTLFDDSLACLEFLSARYPLVSLSNGNADLQRVGLAPYFRAAISAREFGVGKPDPRIFVAAAGAVDVQHVFRQHVGDDMALDALGALNAGMQAAWINRDEQMWPHEATPHLTLTSLDQLCALFRDND
jgi:HAD superfamily hydrolase (TIGR01549 family)